MNNFFKKRNQEKFKPKVVGQIRQNQLITSFGIGFMVDFVKDTVMIAGVDDWNATDESLKLYNENLQSLTCVKFFLKPKTDESQNSFSKSLDIPSYVFPEKQYCPNCKRIYDIKVLENQIDHHKCLNCGGYGLIASRFVVICENGHIEDFPYDWWVHKGKCCESGKKNHVFEMKNLDDKSSIDSLIVKCLDCGKARRIQQALQENALSGENGYRCRGYHPHLKKPMYFSNGECNAVMKTRMRTSSSIYFPVIQSALSIPPWSRDAVKAIISKYDDMEWIEESRLEEYLKVKLIPNVSKNITVDELLKAYEIVKLRKKSKIIRKQKDIYQDEYIELSKGNSNKNNGEFSTFNAKIPIRYQSVFEEVVVVDRLTEVQALCGFTRLKPWDGATLDDERIVKLSVDKKDWLPAVKMNGEGIFFKFNSNRIKLWAKNNAGRYDNLAKNYRDSKINNDRFSSEFISLHSFAHLLMRQISNECGYSVASLKEKIYSTFYDGKDNNVEMYGVLIYLATADSDGSLGGLISIAENPKKLESILDNMLENALWCSADPLCVNSTEQGYLSLNYAACHDCLLVPETSCEFRNCYLDRVSIIGKVEKRSLGLFGDSIK